jgi:hypothetical protein
MVAKGEGVKMGRKRLPKSWWEVEEISAEDEQPFKRMGPPTALHPRIPRIQR